MVSLWILFCATITPSSFATNALPSKTMLCEAFIGETHSHWMQQTDLVSAKRFFHNFRVQDIGDTDADESLNEISSDSTQKLTNKIKLQLDSRLKSITKLDGDESIKSLALEFDEKTLMEFLNALKNRTLENSKFFKFSTPFDSFLNVMTILLTFGSIDYAFKHLNFNNTINASVFGLLTTYIYLMFGRDAYFKSAISRISNFNNWSKLNKIVSDQNDGQPNDWVYWSSNFNISRQMLKNSQLKNPADDELGLKEELTNENYPFLWSLFGFNPDSKKTWVGVDFLIKKDTMTRSTKAVLLLRWADEMPLGPRFRKKEKEELPVGEFVPIKIPVRRD